MGCMIPQLTINCTCEIYFRQLYLYSINKKMKKKRLLISKIVVLLLATLSFMNTNAQNYELAPQIPGSNYYTVVQQQRVLLQQKKQLKKR